jgi:hypothetical protein
MRGKAKLVESALLVLALILINSVTFIERLHIAVAVGIPSGQLPSGQITTGGDGSASSIKLYWGDCINLAHQQSISPQKPEPLPLDDCYQSLLDKFGMQFLNDISANPSSIYTNLQKMNQGKQKPSLAQLLSQHGIKLNIYQLERQELATVDANEIDRGSVDLKVIKDYNAVTDKSLFDQFIKQQLPIISNQTVDQFFTNAILDSRAVCKLIIRNYDTTIDDTLHSYQIAFDTVCPELVARFGSKTDVAKPVVLRTNPPSTSDASPSAFAAFTDDGISLNDYFARGHPKQLVGTLIHELTHVVQAHEDAPSWFVEGMADYVASIYGPTDDSFFLASGVQSGDSYKYGYAVASRFLHWLDQHTTPTIVDQLSHAAQTGGSFSATFQRLTGGTVDEEWSKYVADPTLKPFKHIRNYFCKNPPAASPTPCIEA